MSDQRPYCYHPFINLTIEAGGHIRPCCATHVNLGTVTEVQNIKEFWHKSDAMQNLRTQMKAGEAPDGDVCASCIRSDENGLMSKRVRYIEKVESKEAVSLEHRKIKVMDRVEDPQIRDLDISFSRTCNLQCATCNSRYSSKWFADDKKRLKHKLVPMNDIGEFIGVNPLLSDDQIDQLIEMSKDSIGIVVKGGEPFLDSGFKKFIVKLDNKENKTISCVTNGTIYDEEILTEILKFNRQYITISFDGVEDVHNWIRRSDEKMYSNMIKNAKFLKKIETNCVISAFNIFTIDEYVESLYYRSDFEITNAAFHSIAKRAYESALVFDNKYIDIAIDKLKRCIKIIESDRNKPNMSKVEYFQRAIEYFRSDVYKDYHSIANRKKFILNYDEILIPSRGYCLSDIDPIFGEALLDLRKRCA